MRPLCAGQSMKLSELGELGLLAELERRGLARHIEHDAAQLGGGRRRAPPLRLAEGCELAAHAHALLDISDGIAADVAHMAARSHCGVVVELERVPLADGAMVDDLRFGEDYELLAAVAEPTR